MFASAIALASLINAAQQPMPKIGMTLMPAEPLSEATYLGAMREQIRLGIDSIMLSSKWSDIEGEQPFSLKQPEDQFGVARIIGGQVVYVIKPIDTNVKSVPLQFVQKSFDDPEFIKRWEAMLEKLIPVIPKDVAAIAIGNEVDIYLGEHPTEVAPYLGLVRSTRSMLRGAGIKAPVGVVTTFEGLTKRAAIVKQIHTNFDAVFMTYYPLNPMFEVLPISQVPGHFDQMVAAAAGKPLYITEMGMPASEVCKSSEDLQAEFVTTAFGQLRKHSSKIAFASYFMQSDYTNVMLDVFEQYYAVKDDRFRAFLGTLGLRKTDGTPRKANAEFRKQMRLWTDGS
jgi:hypothetical protein